jgi:pyruvate/2-oxoglutarate dehydrogenase complex dihydrolipoamide dehydrogenase (E3) component
MATEDFDSIVIGAGQAGPALAARLAGAGERVALIERQHLGGTCVNVGCMPTKTMVASAYAAWIAREGARFGVRTGAVSVDMPRVRARKDEVVMTARGNLTRWMENTAGVTLIRGHGCFASPHEVDVGDRRLKAARIFINVGATASIPPIPGIDKVKTYTNADIMDLDVVPAHLLVVGGSYIGLEFGQVFRRLGAKVTVVERAPRLLPREDPEISMEITGILSGEGVALHANVSDLAVKPMGDLICATFHDEMGMEQRIDVSHVLVATGRAPNTADLGLDAAGLTPDARGFIPVDDECRTAQPHIWALGEVNGKGAFTHTAYNDFEIVAANLLDGGSRRISDRQLAYALFIDPPLGRIGMTEADARAAGRIPLVGVRKMARVGRAVESGETRGMMKIVFCAQTRMLLGAAIIGFRGDEAVQFLLPALYKGMTDRDIMGMVGIHPTVTELLPYAIADARPVDG